MRLCELLVSLRFPEEWLVDAYLKELTTNEGVVGIYSTFDVFIDDVRNTIPAELFYETQFEVTLVTVDFEKRIFVATLSAPGHTCDIGVQKYI